MQVIVGGQRTSDLKFGGKPESEQCAKLSPGGQRGEL